MRSIPLIVLINLILTGICSSQIQGFVYDRESNLSLAGANVYLLFNEEGTSTDSDGYFRISTPQNDVLDDSLIISFLGYQDYRELVSKFKEGMNIYLKPQKLELEESIEIIADRLDLAQQEIPHLREIVKQEQIERYGTSDISDIFKRMPAVRVEGNDIDGRHVQVRGSNSSEVKVYLDGVILNNLSFDNSADLSLIPVENIKKLEVLKGSNLPLLGNGAFGGALNILSRNQLETGAMIKVKAGSFETRQLLGSLNLPVTNKLFVSYFGQYNEMQPEIEYFPGERYSDKSMNESVFSKKINHSINIDYFNDYGQFRGKVFTYFFDYKKPGWQNSRDNYLYAFTFSAKNDLNFLLSLMDSKDIVNRYSLTSTQNINEYQTNNVNFRVSKKINFKSSGLQILGEYFHDELDRYSRIKNEDLIQTFNKAEIYNNRAGLSVIYSFEDKAAAVDSLHWKTFLGIRGDLAASGYKDLTNTLGLELTYTRNKWNWQPYVSYGKNVKYPTLLESAYAGDILNITNSDTTFSLLLPEYNNSFELGLNISRYLNRFYGNSFNATLAFFHNAIYNKILMRPMGDQIVQSQIGRNTSRGVEASIKLDEVLNTLDVSASYLRLDISNLLLYEYRPEESISFQFDYYSGFGLYCNAIYFYEGKSYGWYFNTENELQTQEISPHFDIDVSLGYRFKISGIETNLQVSAYNLLDNAGYQYYYLKKQYIQASLAISY